MRSRSTASRRACYRWCHEFAASRRASHRPMRTAAPGPKAAVSWPRWFAVAQASVTTTPFRAYWGRRVADPAHRFLERHLTFRAGRMAQEDAFVDVCSDAPRFHCCLPSLWQSVSASLARPDAGGASTASAGVAQVRSLGRRPRRQRVAVRDLGCASSGDLSPAATASSREEGDTRSSRS